MTDPSRPAADARPFPAPLRDLSLREFRSFPDLAAWCRPRIPEQAQPRFAMGHGDAFVALIHYMRAAPQADIVLLAFSAPASGGLPERLKFVFACRRSAGSRWLQQPSDAQLLYADLP